MDKSLLELLDDVDSAGWLDIEVGDYWLSAGQKSLSLEKKIIALTEGYFSNIPLENALSVKITENFFDRSQCIQTGRNWKLRINFLSLFGFPGVEPKAEIVDFKKFLESTKPFFEKYCDRPADIQICNEKKNRKTTWSLRARYQIDPGGMATDQEFTDLLNAQVKASAGLGGYLLSVAKSLDTIGPHSWFSLTEEHVFESGNGPRREFIRNRLRQAE